VEKSLVGLDTNYVGTTFTLTDGVNEASDYNFKVRSKNIYGWGPYSSIKLIKASAAPAEPAMVTTSIVGKKLKIVWVKPKNNGDVITSYEVLI
jgi:hypothetical protein